MEHGGAGLAADSPEPEPVDAEVLRVVVIQRDAAAEPASAGEYPPASVGAAQAAGFPVVYLSGYLPRWGFDPAGDLWGCP